MGELATTIRRADPIEYLMRRKFGTASIGSRSNIKTIIAGSSIEFLKKSVQNYQIQESYCLELSKKSEEEIQKLVIEEKENEKKEIEDSFFFNQPNANADFKSCFKMPKWNKSEEVALLMMKNPKIINLDACVYNIRKNYSIKESVFFKKYLEIMELFVRCNKAGTLSYEPSPLVFLTWAKNNDFNVPEQLEKLIREKWEKPAIEQNSYEKLKKEHAEYVQKNERIIRNQEQQINDLLSEQNSLKASIEKNQYPGERAETTYLNIIGGLLHILLGQDSKGKKYSSFKTQNEIIEMILVYYPNTFGISKRTLEEKFASANRSLASQ